MSRHDKIDRYTVEKLNTTDVDYINVLKDIDNKTYARADKIFAHYWTSNNRPPKISNENIFKRTISIFNRAIIFHALSTGNPIKLPCNMGYIVATKIKVDVKVHENGELDLENSRLLVDRKATLDLWKENPEAKKLKKLVYRDLEYYISIKWMKPGIVNAKCYYLSKNINIPMNRYFLTNEPEVLNLYRESSHEYKKTTDEELDILRYGKLMQTCKSNNRMYSSFGYNRFKNKI